METLNIFMLAFQILLLIIFLISGIVLLKTLKTYSQAIYQLSKKKILFTLIIWTLAFIYEITFYGLLIGFSDSSEDTESFMYKLKVYSLSNDTSAYSLIYIATIVISEYLPLLTLLWSLVKSYKNNMKTLKHACGPHDLLEDE